MDTSSEQKTTLTIFVQSTLPNAPLTASARATTATELTGRMDDGRSTTAYEIKIKRQNKIPLTQNTHRRPENVVQMTTKANSPEDTRPRMEKINSNVDKNIENVIKDRLASSIDIKTIGFIVYTLFMMLTLNSYALVDIIEFSILITVACLANIMILMYFRTRHPSEKTVLNHLFVQSCWLKIFVQLYALFLMIFGYVSTIYPDNKLLVNVINLLFSVIVIKALLTVQSSMYIIISVFRMAVFLSPTFFLRVNKAIVKKVATSILFAGFFGEILVAKLVYGECKESPNGLKYFQLFSIPQRAANTRVDREGVCRHFPTWIPLACLLLVLELVRVVAASVRNVRKLKLRIRKEKIKQEIEQQRHEQEQQQRAIAEEVEKKAIASSRHNIMSETKKQGNSLKRRQSDPHPACVSSNASLPNSRRYSMASQDEVLQPYKKSEEKFIFTTPSLSEESQHNTNSTNTVEVSLCGGTKDYILTLLARSYSLVLSIAFFALLIFVFAPEGFLNITSPDVAALKLGIKIELLLCPIFWIVNEDEMNAYCRNCWHKLRMTIYSKM